MTAQMLLQELGLRDVVASIYLYLIKNGSSTILQISRGTGIARSNIYNKIEELKQHSLVSEGILRNKRVIVPEPPDNLKNLAKVKLELAKRSTELLGEGFIKNRIDVPLKFFYGCEGFKKCLNEILNSKSKELFLLLNHDSLSGFNSEVTLRHFEKNRIEKRIYTKVLMPYSDLDTIINSTDEIKLIKQFKEIRFMPEDAFFNMSIIICLNNVYIFTPPSEGHILYLESESVSQSILSIFNTIWSSSIQFKDYIRNS